MIRHASTGYSVVAMRSVLGIVIASGRYLVSIENEQEAATIERILFGWCEWAGLVLVFLCTEVYIRNCRVVVSELNSKTD